MMTTATLPIPAAVHLAPQCPVCGITLTGGQLGWCCRYCALEWPDGSSAAGEYLNPEVERCGRELRPYEAGLARQVIYRGAVFRCIRPATHIEREHPADLCAGLRVVGGDGVPRARTWYHQAVTQ